jgi:hypothetical protein
VIAIDEAGNQSAIVTRNYSFMNILSAVNPVHGADPPDSGHVGSSVSIQLTGYGFDASASSNIKLFDQLGASLDSWSATVVNVNTINVTFIITGLVPGVGYIRILQTSPNVANDTIPFLLLP